MAKIDVTVLTREEKVAMMSRLDDLIKSYRQHHENGVNLCFCNSCEPQIAKIRALINDAPEIKHGH